MRELPLGICPKCGRVYNLLTYAHIPLGEIKQRYKNGNPIEVNYCDKSGFPEALELWVVPAVEVRNRKDRQSE